MTTRATPGRLRGGTRPTEYGGRAPALADATPRITHMFGGAEMSTIAHTDSNPGSGCGELVQSLIHG